MKLGHWDSDSGVEGTRYRPGRPALRWLPYLLILLPAALSFAFVGAFGVNVVVRDQWEMVRLFAEFASGTLSFGDLWATHNEHRFFFPRIAMLVLGTLTDWNNLAEMYLIQVCLLVTLAILFLAFRRDVGSNRPLLFVPVAFLILSFRQWSNMLWGYQLTFALTLLSGVLSLFFLRTAALAWRAGRRGSGGAAFVAALSGATVAAGSSIQGLLVWPAGLLPLLAARLAAREKAVFTGIWTCAGVGVWSVYFTGHDAHLGTDSSLPNLLADPALGVGFFLSLLGNSLTSRPVGALVCGLLLVVLAAAVAILARRARIVADYSFWLSLVALSFLILLAITAGRGGGTEGALASRYTTFSLIAVASLYVALVKLWLEGGSHFTLGLLGLLAAAVLLSVPLSYRNGVVLGAAEERSNRKAVFVLSTYRSRTDAELQLLHKRPETVRRNAPTLDRLDYNVFSEPRG